MLCRHVHHVTCIASTTRSLRVALLPEKTKDFYPFSDLTVSKKQSTGLATDKYQTHLKFIYCNYHIIIYTIISYPFRPDTSLTFCWCLSSQNQKISDKNLRIIFSFTCQKTTQKLLPQKKIIT